MSEVKNERLSTAARDVLLAEALGDIHRLQESINTVTAMVQKLKSHVDGQAQQEMVAVLDQKMNEFRHFQISVLYWSERLILKKQDLMLNKICRNFITQVVGHRLAKIYA